ncbi:hypothetical protein [Nostocoides japonicum]|nr:hypothetical protein [Tetrasphaera japonica]
MAQMMWGYPVGWGGFLVMLAAMVLLWTLVVTAIVVLLRVGDSRAPTAGREAAAPGHSSRGER